MMMKSIRNSSKLVLLVFVVLISVMGCKSKKKAAELSNAAAEKAKIEQEERLRKQREEEERKRTLAAEEQARRDAEERARKEREALANTPEAKLGKYFESISSASSVAAANSSINEALSLFASPETPVLIVISESGGQKDYDRPTTIRDYLNYLKDQKKNANRISALKTDGSGKITEVELKK